MDIQELIKRGWQYREGSDEFASIVEKALGTIEMPIGTTKLVEIILPNATSADFNRLTSMLWGLRQRPDTRDFWRYTGKKTSFGKPALHWLPLAKARAMAKRDAEIASWSKEEF